MQLKECSANKLKRISKGKKIICFGAGGNFFYVFETYRALGLEKNVAFVLDNDEQKIGTFVCVNGCKVEVKSPNVLKTLDFNEYVIVITALRHYEIFSQIQNLCGNPHGNCYNAPNRKYQLTYWLEKMVCLWPLKNILLFWAGTDTYDNLAALKRYFVENGYLKKYKVVWMSERPEQFVNSKNEKSIYVRSHMNSNTIKEVIRYYMYMGRAKYIFYEDLQVQKLRDDQILVYLNHGSPPLKATKGLINMPKDLNYAVSPSNYSNTIISEQYSINKERILVCGSPRTDIFFEEDRDDSIRKYLNIFKYSKVLLWVPTFRQVKNSNRVDSNKTFMLGIPIVSSTEKLEKLMDKLKKENVLLLLKPHQVQDLQYLQINQTEHFKMITQEDLVQLSANIFDLMKLADGMITDYSTIAFDYMLLNKPIGYTVDDMDSYKIGFSVDNVFELMPGAKIHDITELIEFVENVCCGVDEYAICRMEVNRKVHDYPDGNNCARLCDKLGIRK